MTNQSYQIVKARSKARSASIVLAGQDIGAIPAVVDPDRRARADSDFRFFCENYFPKLFTMAWSKDHLRVIAKIEQTVIIGALFALAMPRASGKTTLCRIAVLWALLTGRHKFVYLIAATEDRASQALDDIKRELLENPQLLEDYPEVVYPIRCLEGESRRCSGQRYYGQRTYVGWTSDAIAMPSIPGSRCSGAIVRTAGLTGNIRGAVHTLPDGTSVRPSLVVIDDPQTDDSARSPSQVQERLNLVNGAILNLCGPGKKIAAIMPCTVIRANDLADQILDRDKHPNWQGERMKMVYRFPTNEKLWAEYYQILDDSLRNDGNGQQATEFYRANRQAMDEGAEVAWEARFASGELSALQHAMNLKHRDEGRFAAEYQNEPMPEVPQFGGTLTADEIAAKSNGMKRGEVAVGATRMTAFIDIQGTLLYWMVCAWEESFTGYILDYGTYPDQQRAYFTLRDSTQTMQSVHTRVGPEGVIRAGLEALTEQLMGREWKRDDGDVMRIDRCLIDANWSKSADVVYQLCRESKHAALLIPSHGKGFGASSIPMSDYRRKLGDRIGMHWRIPGARGNRPVRHVLFDAHYYKSFVHARLAVARGDPGCLSLFGGFDHTLLADHLTAEYPVTVEAKGRKVDEWHAITGRDNHWFDCLVGCAVAASIQGVALPGTQVKMVPAKTFTFAERLKSRKVWKVNRP